MRIPQLTFTRFVAALAIVLFHTGERVWPFSHPTVLPVLEAANMAVSYFFALSGFILVVSSVRQGQPPGRIAAGRFWRNRVARIYPLYALALTLFLALALTARTTTLRPEPVPVAATYAMLQAWVPPWALLYNYPGWSLSVKALFYALFPALYGLLRPRASGVVLWGSTLR